jgi:creatinine amidohydrolase
VDLKDLTWPAVAALSRDIPVVYPMAALEQHGRHLPLFTDSYLLGEIVRRVTEQLAERVLFAPLTWLGNSHHHLDFAGTLSAEPRHYLDALHGLVEALLGHGFRRFVFLNGHGGNDVPGRQAIFEVRQRHRNRDGLLVLFATYWNLGVGPVTGVTQQEMGHACEWETSMMLRIAPQLVGDFTEAPPIEPGRSFLPAARAWTTRERSASGHIGWPHLATAEKGELLLERFASEVSGFLERVIAWDGSSWNG